MEEKPSQESERMVKASTIWTWVKILALVGGVVAFVTTVSVLFYMYGDGLSFDEEDTRPKELTPEMVRNNPGLNKHQETPMHKFVTNLMEREGSLNSMIDNYDKLEKGATTLRPHGA